MGVGGVLRYKKDADSRKTQKHKTLKQQEGSVVKRVSEESAKKGGRTTNFTKEPFEEKDCAVPHQGHILLLETSQLIKTIQRLKQNI